jgi:hypothetical protein
MKKFLAGVIVTLAAVYALVKLAQEVAELERAMSMEEMLSDE